MALLAVFQPDPVARARVVSALADEHETVLFDDWRTLRDALPGLPADGCVLDPYYPPQRVPLAEIRQLREMHASVALVVYADFRGHELDLFTLGRLRIDAVVPCAREGNPREIREGVAEALASSVAATVVEALRRRLGPLALECLRWSIEHGHALPRVRELAAPLCRSPRSLTRSLRRQGAPPPGRLLLWGRLFRAVHMLGDRGATLERVALAIGYSGGAALARALRRETGCATAELLRRGGLARALEGFVARELPPPGARPAVRPHLPLAGSLLRVP